MEPRRGHFQLHLPVARLDADVANNHTPYRRSKLHTTRLRQCVLFGHALRLMEGELILNQLEIFPSHVNYQKYKDRMR